MFTFSAQSACNLKMSFTRRVYSIRKNHSNVSFRNISITRVAKKAASANENTQPLVLDEETISFDKEVNVAGRIYRRKASLPPFMKDIFLAVYNRDLLAYPEVLNKEEYDTLVKHLNSIKFAMTELKNVEDIYKSLRSLRVMSAPATAFHGGLASIVTERLRMLEELSVNLPVAKTVAGNWAGLDSIIASLSISDMEKIVPAIIEDGRPISMCLSERACDEPGKPDFQTAATLKPDGSWSLQGGKHCINHEGWKVVMAVTPAYKIYPYLVEPNASGLTYEPEWVNFNDTPCQRLIDSSKEEDLNAECLKKTNGRLRLYKSVLACARLKNLIPKVCEYVRGKYIGGKPYADFPLAQDKLVEAHLTAYAAEAMIYFTAGLDDGYIDQDTSVEMAMCRIYSTERCLEAADALLSVLNRNSLLPEWQEEFQAIKTLLYEDCESNDALHIYVGMMGLQHSGVAIATDVRMLRNPLFNPMFTLKRVFANRNQEIDNPTLTLQLEQHLHPSLIDTARSLEYCVLRLKFATETALTRYGSDVTEVFREVKRISQAATEIFAMSASISRASRSYCIGLRNANCDLHMANQVVEMGKRRVKMLVSDVDGGEYFNFDANRRELAVEALEHKGFLVEHSLERVFW